MRFINKRNIEPFDLNSPISLFQVVPTFLRKHLILSWGIYKFIRIIFTAPRVVKHIVNVVHDVELGNRTWMYSLSLEFLTYTCILLPHLVPIFRYQKHWHSVHYYRSIILFSQQFVELTFLVCHYWRSTDCLIYCFLKQYCLFYVFHQF